MGLQKRERAVIAAAVNDPLIVARDASFGYNQRVKLAGINLQLCGGESIALIGSNGSGKSTLLAGIVGLSQHLSGELQVLGGSPAKTRASIGLLPQQDTRRKDIPVTTYQVVAMGLYKKLGMFKPFRRRDKDLIAETLQRVGLREQAKTRFNALSGGQQQRAILARALVSDPLLLLLDEPFNGLDKPSRESLLETIREVQTRGCGVVVSTHDLEIARDSCTHALLLDKRQIAFDTVQKALTPENIAATFRDTTVEIAGKHFTTRHEAAGHTHADHLAGKPETAAHQHGGESAAPKKA